MEWRDLLLASWAVDPGMVERRLPERVALDRRDGRAWLSVVPFVMADVRPRGVPRRLGRTFPELNLRTYVTVDGDPGVYFFTLDAADRLGVALARRLFHLPYRQASMAVDRDGDRVRYESERPDGGAAFDATYAPSGPASRAEQGSLAAFLAERYRFVAPAGDRLYVGRVHHPPWELAPAEAEIRRNGLFEACGFDDPGGDPHLLYGRPTRVSAPLPRRR